MRFMLALSLLTLLHLHPTSTGPVLEAFVPEEDYKKHGLAIDAIFSMGLRLRAIMDTSTRANFVVSPISTTAIISQLMLGAEGEFQEQLYDLLSLPVSNQKHMYRVHYLNKKNNNETCFILPHANFHLQLSSLIRTLQKKSGELFTLNLNNALFHNEDIKLLSYFLKSLRVIYNTEIRHLNLYKDDTKSIINQWAAKHTNGLIKTILQASLPITTTSVFMNAVYFRADWETPFSDILNIDDEFHTGENDTVEATFMTGLIPKVLYAETKDYRVTCLPYKNRELGMYIVFPNKDNQHRYDINKFLEQMKPQELLQSIATGNLRDVVIRIPKLSLSNTLSILKPLQKYSDFKQSVQMKKGNDNVIDEILNEISNYKNFNMTQQREIVLTKAADGENLRVSNIVQQMVFSINEKGTEAAAVSLAITDYMGGSKTMVLNRPFVFFIRHEATLATLFWGTISDPSKN